MTILEAVEQGVHRLRMPLWNEFRYLELHLVEIPGTNIVGPWAVLFDPQASCTLNQKIGLNVPLLSEELAKESRYEEFPGYSAATLEKLKAMRLRHGRTLPDDLTSVERELDEK